MAEITADLIKKLRERTGAGVMECKKALITTLGDIELAIDSMRKLGHATAAKKAGRIAVEGVILTKIAQGGKYGVILELNCETDFAAKSSSFKAFGCEAVTLALNERIVNVEVLKDKLEEKRVALVARFGENINIRRLGVLEGSMLGFYVHGARISVIVSTIGANKELVKHVAMHIAASKPEYVSTLDIPSDVLARENQIQLDIATKSGKSHEIIEKIVEGRMRKFTSEIALTSQYFVMDPNKTVGQLLSEQCAKVNKFIRFEVGERID